MDDHKDELHTGELEMNNVKEGSNKHMHGTGGSKVKDPVCGMDINAGSASGKIEHGGHTYYFCSSHCQDKFRAEPARYEDTK
jgi:Cu+-exporting ATPase